MENVCINVTSSKDGNKAEKSEKRKHFIHYFDLLYSNIDRQQSRMD